MIKVLAEYILADCVLVPLEYAGSDPTYGSSGSKELG